MAALTHVDNSDEIFGDKTSIADLAHNSFGGMAGEFNSALDIPIEAVAILKRDWPFEISETKIVGRQVIASFKDGSKITIQANGVCCSVGDCDRCHNQIEGIQP